MKFFDSNVLWGNWQFQGIFTLSPDKLENTLRQKGIENVLVRMPDAAICPDIEKCNRLLFEAFTDNKNIIPVPTLNPKMPDWKTQLEKFHSPAVNLYPGYHGYSLLDPETAELAALLEKEKRSLMITLRLEDARAANPYCRFPNVPVTEIKAFLEKFSGLKTIFLNASFGEIKEISQTANENFLADIAFVETLNTVESLLEFLASEQLIFGSNTPLFYTEAAIFKITKSSCNEICKREIAYENLRKSLNEKV
ncbi:MAG: hypothetical protein WC082_14500 [Victivallales bacterium]